MSFRRKLFKSTEQRLLSFRRKLFKNTQERLIEDKKQFLFQTFLFRKPINSFLLNNIRNSLIVVLSFLISFQSNAQSIATAKVDSNKIFVGQPVHLEVELKQNRTLNIPWFQLPDSIGKIEIIEKGNIDTVKNSDATILQRKQMLTLSAYDSGYFVIPPFEFFNNGDTAQKVAETNPLLISVFTVPVDTTKPIKDIRGVVEVPLTWRDYLPWVLGVLGILLAALVGYYFYQKRKNRPLKVFEKKIPARPAHEIALEELQKLDAEKVWQQGNFKSYHTRLTDIIRQFIEHRWSVNAMELTTDEILQHSFALQLNNASREHLATMLLLADMVKFAKAQPIANENEQSMRDALQFVNANAQVALPKPELSKEEVKHA